MAHFSTDVDLMGKSYGGREAVHNLFRRKDVSQKPSDVVGELTVGSPSAPGPVAAWWTLIKPYDGAIEANSTAISSK